MVRFIPVCFLQLSLFFFNDTATTEIYTLSLHDALPISEDPDAALLQVARLARRTLRVGNQLARIIDDARVLREDRKSTRLNSSHGYISYAVFCLKKKKRKTDRSTVLVIYSFCLIPLCIR